MANPLPTYFSVRIPTRSYLRKFIEHETGTPVVTPGDHPIQQFLYILLEKKFYKYKFDWVVQRYTDELTIEVSDWTFHRIGHSVSPANVIIFNNYVQNLFDRALYNFCQDYMKYNDVLQNGILQMAERYSIQIKTRQHRAWFKTPRHQDAMVIFCEQVLKMEMEKDITFDALKKMEYRARKKFEKTLLPPVPYLHNELLTLDFSGSKLTGTNN